MIVPYTAAEGPSDIPKASSWRVVKRNFVISFRKLVRWWAALHISYRGGQYSVQRLLALQQYTQTTPLWRVLLVCASFPVPATAFLIAQEAVPLQDPADGWSANYGFWVRAVLVCAAVFYTILVQLQCFFPQVEISRRQIVVLVVGAAFVQCSIAALVSAYIFFPIPFCVITMVPAFYVVMMVSFCVVVGTKAVREIVRDTQHTFRFIGFIGTQQLMAVICPMYQVLFHAVAGTKYALPVIVLLPCIKLMVKYAALRCVTHKEDLMPEAVIFTVDFFNALYLATSMESASSASTVAIITLLDVVQTLWVVYRLYQQTSTVMARLQVVTRSLDTENNLLDSACCLSRSMLLSREENHQKLRTQSCLSYHLALQNLDFVKQLSKETLVCNLREPVAALPQPKRNTLIGQDSDVLQKSLEVLFTTECLVLSASLDVMVPLFYGCFMLVIIRFPSANYHTELGSVTTESVDGVVSSVFFLASVQIIAFVLLGTLIRRNIGIMPLYQVAFVLETQTESLQSKLLCWMLMTMAFRVIHFGNCDSHSPLVEYL